MKRCIALAAALAAWACGAAAQETTLNAVLYGVVDVASVAPTFYTNFCPECGAQILAPQKTPQLKKTPFWTALEKYTNQKVKAHLLTAYADGIDFHIWTTKPPAGGTLKGMRLRTTPNYTPLFQALGVSLVQTPPGEVMTALERGVVDGNRHRWWQRLQLSAPLEDARDARG